MKKQLLLFVVFLILAFFTLSGCSENKPSAQAAEKTGTVEKPN